MAKSTADKFDIRTEATRPLYAGVGVADLAVERVREYVGDVQKRFDTLQKDLQKRIDRGDFQPKVLRRQAVTVVNERVDALTKEARARRYAIEARVADLQADALELPVRVQELVNEGAATATDTYGDLAERGETLIARIRRQQSTQATVSSAKTTTAKARTTRTQATKATRSTASTAKGGARTTAKKTSTTAKKSSATPKSSAKATGTTAKKTASNATQAGADAARKVGD